MQKVKIMIEVTLTNCSYMGLVDPLRKHKIPLPANDTELDKIIQSEAYFVDKFGYLTVTPKSHNRFREYVCQSKLGLVNGGYQQLQAIWKTLTPEVSKKNASAMKSDLPFHIWGYIEGDDIFYFENKDEKIRTIWDLRFYSHDQSTIYCDYGTLSELHGCYHVAECAKLSSDKELLLHQVRMRELFQEFNFKVSPDLINFSTYVDDKKHECFYFKLERI